MTNHLVPYNFMRFEWLPPYMSLSLFFLPTYQHLLLCLIVIDESLMHPCMPSCRYSLRFMATLAAGNPHHITSHPHLVLKTFPVYNCICKHSEDCPLHKNTVAAKGSWAITYPMDYTYLLVQELMDGS